MHAIRTAPVRRPATPLVDRIAVVLSFEHTFEMGWNCTMEVAPHPSKPMPPRAEVLRLLGQSQSLLAEAARSPDAADRFRLAHLSALRTAAALFAGRSRPARARRRLCSAWVLLDAVAPELGEWSAYFAAGAATRAAVEAGVLSAVSARQADEELRAAGEFLAVAHSALGLAAASALAS
jgi:SAV_6107-like HEPN